MEKKDQNPRLSKVMSERGLCSRREADEWIERGWVFVNGEQVRELGLRVPPTVKIDLSEHAKRAQQRLITVLLNKPVGWVSAQPEKNYRPAIELLGPENFGGDPADKILDPRRLDHLAVAGRLDIDSQGLLVFTQDGRLAKHLIGENSHIEKEYLVRIRGNILPEQIKRLKQGNLVMDGKKLKPFTLEQINENQLRFVLIEGRKRQVRRMCELVQMEVSGLKRVRIGNIPLGKLPEGKWRYLDSSEMF